MLVHAHNALQGITNTTTPVKAAVQDFTAPAVKSSIAQIRLGLRVSAEKSSPLSDLTSALTALPAR
jgi:hypothetical protein